jgi:hypothetical protein
MTAESGDWTSRSGERLRARCGTGPRYSRWPACPASTEENWQQTVQELKLPNKKLGQAVRDFPEKRPDDPSYPRLPTPRTRSSSASLSTTCMMLARARC